MIKQIDRLLEKNAFWQEKQIEKDPSLFEKSAKTHSPKFFCITCSDARLCLESIMQLSIGEVFVHRNVANLIKDDDVSLVAATTLAFESLGIRQVIICAHYGCQGVASAFHDLKDFSLKSWLQPIKNLYQKHQKALDLLASEELKHDRLVELHLKEQIQRFKSLPVYERAQDRGEIIQVSALIYDMRTGLLHKV